MDELFAARTTTISLSRPIVKRIRTLLDESKTRGEVDIWTTCESHRARVHASGDRHSMASEIDRSNAVLSTCSLINALEVEARDIRLSH
jgi:hypothetical protein